MAQIVRYVDLTRSFMPMDPNSFPEGMHVYEANDEGRIPVMAYDGANFLPTAYGYKSFFGTDTYHPADALAERIDAVLIFQNESRNNIMFALCDSGIWSKAGTEVGAWTQEVILPDYRDSTEHHPWTWCVLDNELYVYRMNNDKYYRIKSDSASPGFLVEDVTPSFLNMEAQVGIFRAGNRLGFWDTDNSVSWSSQLDFADFTPNMETLAGNAKYSAVVGRIVTIKSMGDAFIIYATKSIVYLAKADSSLYLWEPVRVLKDTGISYMEEVVESIPDTTQFAFTNTGIYKIVEGSAEVIVPEIYDFFKLIKAPKYLKLIEGRYLVFEVLDTDFVNAFPQQTNYPVPALGFTLTAANLAELYLQAENGDISPANLLSALQNGIFNQPPVEDEGGGEGPGGPGEGPGES